MGGNEWEWWEMGRNGWQWLEFEGKICKYMDMQVCAYANMCICEYVQRQVCAYASLFIWVYIIRARKHTFLFIFAWFIARLVAPEQKLVQQIFFCKF